MAIRMLPGVSPWLHDEVNEKNLEFEMQAQKTVTRTAKGYGLRL